MNLDELYQEVVGYLNGADLNAERGPIIEGYEQAVSVIVRLQQIRNDIAYLEMIGTATPQEKKFRTTILDPTIETFKTVAAFESRKITAKKIEFELDREGKNVY